MSISTILSFGSDDTVTAKLKHFEAGQDVGGCAEFWSIDIFSSWREEVTLHFHNIEQLQAFDESLHGDIEDALFNHHLAATPDKTLGEARTEAAEGSAD